MLKRRLRITLLEVLLSDPVLVALSGLLRPELIVVVVPLMLEQGFCVALSAVRVPCAAGDDLIAFEVIAVPYFCALLSSLAPGSGAVDTVVAPAMLVVDLIAMMCLWRA